MPISVDFTKPIAKMKPMHGVGQPPFAGSSFKMFHYLTEAGIPFSRLHDVGGIFGGGRWVDIPNLFRDFDADPCDPASYDFTFTDMLIKALMECGAEPFFRLGVTIENDAAIKSYRIDLPKDPHKWAVICEHVIRHYTEGWADGFTYNIRYWEIWNEPENFEDPRENQMWTGTKEQYYELYDVTARHLKKCFPHLKIGGYASCGFYATTAANGGSSREKYFLTFFDGFLEYVKSHGSPMDFFSWHSYSSIENTVKWAQYARDRLDEAGFTDCETTCNEWNPEVHLRGSAKHASLVAGMMLGFQNSPLDSAMFYDARYGTSIYGSMFNPLTAEPFPAYYSFAAFNELYKRGTQIEVTCDIPGVYAVGAKDEDGAVVIANTNACPAEMNLTGIGKIKSAKMIREGVNLGEWEFSDTIPAESVAVIVCE
ncbi:MAG: hypothetical protein IJX93_04600 [Clostridia bacterium]|nr:hypothetical protein [Clostridia bacterium]